MTNGIDPDTDRDPGPEAECSRFARGMDENGPARRAATMLDPALYGSPASRTTRSWICGDPEAGPGVPAVLQSGGTGREAEEFVGAGPAAAPDAASSLSPAPAGICGHPQRGQDDGEQAQSRRRGFGHRDRLPGDVHVVEAKLACARHAKLPGTDGI